MLYNTLHNRWLRLAVAIVGELLMAAALNLLIVPLHLYSGGVMGVCQLINTLLRSYLGADVLVRDIAGTLYFLANVPILILAYKSLGRGIAVKTIICTSAYSLFCSVIPIPETPIIEDFLTACLLGGVLTGIGCGVVLTCGASSGGLDVIGLCLSKRDSNASVGKFSLVFNAFLYGACLFLFNAEVAIYSIIYNYVSVTMLDRMHQQNINVQALIFTRDDEKELGDYIMDTLQRGVTYWSGTGAYTGEDIHVLCVCLSKYEIEDLIRVVHNRDPKAFVTVQEGVRVLGNFPRKVG